MMFNELMCSLGYLLLFSSNNYKVCVGLKYCSDEKSENILI